MSYQKSAEDIVNRQEKYPLQIASCIHRTQTLSLECELQAPQSDDAKPVPFLTLHGPFSRFVLTLVDTSGSDTKYASVNIRPTECPDIFERFRIAYQGMLTGKEDNSADAPNSAYTVTLKTGRDKGKTPAAILMENPQNAKSLHETAEWLEKNADRYPTNREIIDAIRNALALFEAGELNEEQAISGQSRNISLFNAGFKVQRGGKQHAGVKIDCDTTRDNPWVFEVENADIVGGDSDKSENWKNMKRVVMCLNNQEMSYVMRQMASILTYFENMWFYDMFNSATDVATSQRSNWGKK